MATNLNLGRHDPLRPRSLSISSAMRLAARGGLERWLDPGVLRARLVELRREQLELRKMVALMSSMPRLTEGELEVLGEADSHCAVCLVPYSTLFAEEELALALDTPAHPIEELGVTRLTDSCGHVFCRRDIKAWMTGNHRTCPTCRQPFFTISDEEVNAANAEASETSAIPSADVIAQIVHDQATMFLGQRVGGGAGAMAGLRVAREVVQRPEVNVSDNDDHEYERPAGMYS